MALLYHDHAYSIEHPLFISNNFRDLPVCTLLVDPLLIILWSALWIMCSHSFVVSAVFNVREVFLFGVTVLYNWLAALALLIHRKSLKLVVIVTVEYVNIKYHLLQAIADHGCDVRA